MRQPVKKKFKIKVEPSAKTHSRTWMPCVFGAVLVLLICYFHWLVLLFSSALALYEIYVYISVNLYLKLLHKEIRTLTNSYTSCSKLISELSYYKQKVSRVHLVDLEESELLMKEILQQLHEKAAQVVEVPNFNLTGSDKHIFRRLYLILLKAKTQDLRNSQPKVSKSLNVHLKEASSEMLKLSQNLSLLTSDFKDKTLVLPKEPNQHLHNFKQQLVVVAHKTNLVMENSSQEAVKDLLKEIDIFIRLRNTAFSQFKEKEKELQSETELTEEPENSQNLNFEEREEENFWCVLEGQGGVQTQPKSLPEDFQLQQRLGLHAIDELKSKIKPPDVQPVYKTIDPLTGEVKKSSESLKVELPVSNKPSFDKQPFLLELQSVLKSRK